MFLRSGCGGSEKRRAIGFYNRQDEREYVSGEAHYFRGGLYRLKVEEDNNSRQGVRIDGDYLVLTVREKSSSRFEEDEMANFTEAKEREYQNSIVEMMRDVNGLAYTYLGSFQYAKGEKSKSDGTRNSNMIEVEMREHLRDSGYTPLQMEAALPGTARYVAAHSLGNMLASSAIADHNLSVSRYFMLNAAVPMEAYNATVVTDSMRNNMTPSDWRSYALRTMMLVVI